MRFPSLREVLYEAQEGRCWLCECKMQKPGGNHARSATLDHVWPRGIFGKAGNAGLCLVACRSCNSSRNDVYPTDEEIRTFVRVWRRVNPTWLEVVIQKQLAAARAAQNQLRQAEILSLFVRAA